MNEDKEEFLGRFPSESEYIRRIDDISAAIKNGGDGYMETQNLLYDLPYPWIDKIKKDIDEFANELKRKNSANIPRSDRINNGRLYSLKVKQRVISFLYEVGMWSPRRQTGMEGSMSLYTEDDKDAELQTDTDRPNP